MTVVVAIDGPAAAGKGTIARAIAETFRLAHLDTGSLYRATAARVLADGGDPADRAAAVAAASALEADDTRRPDLRTAAVADGSSVVAAMPAVRAALLDFQRRFAARVGGAVLDGRDIGTVVCPEATTKLFVSASPAVRARRRAAESGRSVDEEAADLARRDARDSGRADAPMRPAADALLLDTTDLAIDAAIAKAVAFIRPKIDEARARNAS
jgi:cytidylate kinase